MNRSLLCKLLFDDSDENEIIEKLVMETSQPKRRHSIQCNHLVGHERFFFFCSRTNISTRFIS